MFGHVFSAYRSFRIQGVYPIKPPSLPAVGGNEGVGEVFSVGSGVSSLKPKDWVIPSMSGKGIWRSHGVFDERDLLPIPRSLSFEAAATILVNPATAYRMLEDFVRVRAGETVVQNGANSAVGQAVIQLARHRGVKSVNIVRERPEKEMNSLREFLLGLGADVVLTEEEFRKGARMLWKEIKQPRLALNCVGGKNTIYLSASLAQGGVVVTYGGMSKQPLAIPTSALIFNDIALRGFWMSRWYSTRTDEAGRRERMKMMSELAKLSEQGVVSTPPMRKIAFENEREVLDAVGTALEGGGKKVLLVFDK